MPATPDNKLKFTFGDFTLDTSRGALLKFGEEVKLRPQSFDVLRMLVSRHGYLVTKDELHQEIWSNKIVTDDSITHCLLDIRKALGDADKKVIRTVPRRGYIFDAPCRLEELSVAEQIQSRTYSPRSKTFIATALATFLVAVLWVIDVGNFRSSASILQNSVAILPFADMSKEQDQQYLGDGLSSDVLNLLSRSQELLVISRTSSFSFAEESPNIAVIRESLKVAFVLEGSIRRSGNRLSITVQLIDTQDHTNVWSDRYERDARELLAVQTEIAEAVLSHIAPSADMAVVAPTERNFSANQLMYLASYHEKRVRDRPDVNQEELGEAIRLYHEAVEADPESALAHSRLAGALLYSGNVRAAETPTFKALELNRDLSEVQETLGKYNWIRGLPGAGAAWKRAIELNPNNADAHASYGYWRWQQGYSDEPEPYFRTALKLDPLSISRYADLGSFLGMEGRADATLEIAEHVEEMLDSEEIFDRATAYRLIARLRELIGNVDEAIAWTIRARDLEPNNADHVGQLAELYAQIGDFATADSLEPEPGIHLLYRKRDYPAMIELAEDLSIMHPDDIMVRYMLAFAYNATNQFERAIYILRDTGLPESMLGEWKQAINSEALITMAGAFQGIGDTERARELTNVYYNHSHTENTDWWTNTYKACALATLDRDAEALDRLDQVLVSRRLPWYPTLKDSYCFSRYMDEPRYQEVLLNTEARQKQLRERLPKTLKTHAVTL